jgi:Fe2+ transport system protein FeoA
LVYAGIVNNFMTVGDLHRGDTAVVKSFLGGLDSQSRFLEMGILPGVELRLVKIAPLGGTIELKVRDYYLSIRHQDALNIVIEN